MATGSSRGVFIFRNQREGRRPMDYRKACADQCDHHALQRSLYRHALNALQLASRSSCGSELALELAERCAELLRAADGNEALPARQRR
jgi:hypothetical protein